jgi:cobalamin biosynthesis protein CobT
MEKRVNAPLDVVILIDESGSMSGSGKYKRAREVAILIHEALLGIKNINYWCYGHTTGGWSGNSTADVLMSIYHEGPVRDVQDKYKLMRIRADSGNCDGRAILESAGRVKRRISNDRNVLFILISDGAPTESCHGIRPDDYARSAAKYVQDKYKYNFIHVGIDCCNKTLYDISIDYTNPADLSRRIGEVVSSFITRNRSRL